MREELGLLVDHRMPGMQAGSTEGRTSVLVESDSRGAGEAWSVQGWEGTRGEGRGNRWGRGVSQEPRRGQWERMFCAERACWR